MEVTRVLFPILHRENYTRRICYCLWNKNRIRILKFKIHKIYQRGSQIKFNTLRKNWGGVRTWKNWGSILRTSPHLTWNDCCAADKMLLTYVFTAQYFCPILLLLHFPHEEMRLKGINYTGQSNQASKWCSQDFNEWSKANYLQMERAQNVCVVKM